MSALPQVASASHAGGYCLRLLFSDGVEGTVDFERWLKGPVFEPLRDLAFFQRFFIDAGTVAWPNGADIAPETLHESAASANAA